MANSFLPNFLSLKEGACVQRRKRNQNGRPLNSDETLYEIGSKEVWQSTLVTSDSEEIGPVIRQVIEPDMYTIRYFIVYDLKRERHILVPSNAVVDINNARVYCGLSAHDIESIPPFSYFVNRGYEEEVYEAAGRTPHWIEEAGIEPSSRKQDD